MKSNYVLIQYYSNWADEFDVEGYIAVTKEKYDKFIAKLESIENFTFGFGTNEDISYESNSSLKSDFTFTPMSDVEYEALKRLEILEVGMTPYSQIMDYEYEEEEEEDYDDENKDDFIAKPSSGIILDLSSSQLKKYSITTSQSKREEK